MKCKIPTPEIGLLCTLYNMYSLLTQSVRSEVVAEMNTMNAKYFPAFLFRDFFQLSSVGRVQCQEQVLEVSAPPQLSLVWVQW